MEQSRLRYIIRDPRYGSSPAGRNYSGNCPVPQPEIRQRHTVELTKDSYYNMKEKILPVMHIVDRAKAAMERAGISVTVPGRHRRRPPVYEGLPCPKPVHRRRELSRTVRVHSVEDMERCTQMLVELLLPVGQAKGGCLKAQFCKCSF